MADIDRFGESDRDYAYTDYSGRQGLDVRNPGDYAIQQAHNRPSNRQPLLNQPPMAGPQQRPHVNPRMRHINPREMGGGLGGFWNNLFNRAQGAEEVDETIKGPGFWEKMLGWTGDQLSPGRQEAKINLQDVQDRIGGDINWNKFFRDLNARGIEYAENDTGIGSTNAYQTARLNEYPDYYYNYIPGRYGGDADDVIDIDIGGGTGPSELPDLADWLQGQGVRT